MSKMVLLLLLCELAIISASDATLGVLGAEGGLDYVNKAMQKLKMKTFDGSDLAINQTIDSNGWPLVDMQVTVFDDRPTYAWAPPIDDPQTRQADYSGLWMVKITGYADVSINYAAGCKGIRMVNQTYDPFANELLAYLEFDKGGWPKVANLLVLQFNNTRRTASSPNNTGFTDLRVIHENYFDRQEQLFTDEWAALMAPYNHLRFMGAMGMNSYSWLCGGDNPYACSVFEWKDRALPTYALRSGTLLCKGCVGAHPWEHVLLAANELNKDIWINIPITASSPYVQGTNTSSDKTKTYVYQLALLFRDGNEYTNYKGLNPKLNIYIEHSNEVWNYGFKQYNLNCAAAKWEVANATHGKSNLASGVVPWENCTFGGSLKRSQCWCHRRHARRVYEIGQTFEEVFGSGSLNNRIRMVYASWTINLQTYYNNTLTWLEKTYKEPINKYIYAIANTEYFAPDKAWVAQYAKLKPQYIAGTLYMQAATNNTNMTQDFATFKRALGVKLATYEAGTGNDLGGQFSKAGPELSNFILANRDPAIKDALEHDIKDVFWGNGGDIYHQFTSVGKCSRHGCWGATEFYTDPVSPKAAAINELTGHTAAGNKLFAQTRNATRVVRGFVVDE
eukprot:TRINITY_DN8644_c0_g1_i1.p1 TRINITY_DN8644_c0_g1~~TRINITY_DN8644_c0_g1_i1.p1  ORF type:complete len:620 (+),score=168.54 TRINITY_DN8644_c0_g1_i1:126-1985(+)